MERAFKDRDHGAKNVRERASLRMTKLERLEGQVVSENSEAGIS